MLVLGKLALLCKLIKGIQYKTEHHSIFRLQKDTSFTELKEFCKESYQKKTDGIAYSSQARSMSSE